MEQLELIFVFLFFLSLGIICIVSNGLVCYIITTRQFESTFRYYILSLAITDISVGLVPTPLYLVLKWLQYRGCSQDVLLRKVIKRTLVSSEVFLSTCSISHLCLIALDRIVAVSMPIFYRVNMGRKGMMKKVISVPWLFSMLLASLPLILKNIIFAIILEVVIILSGIFIIVSYSVLLCRINKNKVFNDSKRRKVRRSIKTLLTVIVVFTICWVPSIILLVLRTTKTPYPRKLGIPVKFFQYLNAVTNPFIYAFYSPVFRADPRVLMLNSCRSLNCCLTRERAASNAQNTRNEQLTI